MARLSKRLLLRKKFVTPPTGQAGNTGLSIPPYLKGWVWAVPRSLAATRGISNLIYFPLVTKLFQFTKFPPHRLYLLRDF